MSKADKNFTPTSYKSSSRISGGPRGRPRGLSWDTWTATSNKDTIKFELAQTVADTRIEMLGITHDSDEARLIHAAAENDVRNKNISKSELSRELQRVVGYNPLRYAAMRHKRLASANTLLNALYSFNRPKTLFGLDDGDYMEDYVDILTGGDGWAKEVPLRKGYRKHVNIAVDNSGSTFTKEMKYCSATMKSVSNSLLDVLTIAADTYPGITWGGWEFNKGSEEIQIFGKNINLSTFQKFINANEPATIFWRNEPTKEEASETRLAPLLEKILLMEQKHNLIGEPRLDIIIADGEFENQEDADLAGEFQRRRGPGVTTYILNLCLGSSTDIKLPTLFREVPLGIINSNDTHSFIKDEDLRTAMNSIIISEMTKDY